MLGKLPSSTFLFMTSLCKIRWKNILSPLLNFIHMHRCMVLKDNRYGLGLFSRKLRDNIPRSHLPDWSWWCPAKHLSASQPCFVPRYRCLRLATGGSWHAPVSSELAVVSLSEVPKAGELMCSFNLSLLWDGYCFCSSWCNLMQLLSTF